jgi:hypothetical protein
MHIILILFRYYHKFKNAFKVFHVQNIFAAVMGLFGEEKMK